MDESADEFSLPDEHSPLYVAEPLPSPPTPKAVSRAEEARLRRHELLEAHRLRMRKLWKVGVFLFVATCFSTWLTAGPVYAVAVMSILLSHELGHFLQAVRYRISASPPLFIPFPGTPFGTMGAVIVQAGGVANRKQMFDIAISGPLAGLLVALPITWWGLTQSTVLPLVPEQGAVIFGDPLILKWMIQLVHGTLPPNAEVDLNPLLFAGWVGIFITALNLIPIGQLDGGHILYTLIGKRAHSVAFLLVAAAMGYMAYTRDFAYLVMVMLLLWMGTRHPPTADDTVPLGPLRITLGWLTLAFVLVGFTPRPIFELEPTRTIERIPNRPDLDERAVSLGIRVRAVT